MNKIITLDCGHGGSDPGAVSSGIKEKDITFQYALTLKYLLEQEGFKVYLTRYGDVNVPLAQRAYMAIGKDGIFISLHCNSGPNPARGYEVWYHDDNPTSKRLAIAINNAMQQQKFIPTRGIKRDTDRYKSGFCVLRICSQHNIPAVLIELGFITDPADRAALLMRDIRTAICQKIIEGIKSFMEVK